MAEANAIQDPETYRKVSAPFPSTDAANAAIDAFYHDVREARAKHGIRDVHLIMGGEMLSDGNSQEFYMSAHIGSTSNAEAMTAWAFGKAQARRQEEVMRLIEESKALRPIRNRK